MPAEANQNVTYSSSDTNIATVNASGVITANLTLGNATITATTINGLTATCDVTVEPAVAVVGEAIVGIDVVG